jgi:hypothetical protein
MSEMTEDNLTIEPKGSVVAGENERTEAPEETIDFYIVGRVDVEGDASLAYSVAGGVVAGQSVSMTDCMNVAAVAGTGIEMTDSGCGILVAGGESHLQESGAGFLHCQQAMVENSTIGILATPQATLGQDVKVMMTTKQAIAFGAAFGLVVGAIGILFRRRR